MEENKEYLSLTTINILLWVFVILVLVGIIMTVVAIILYETSKTETGITTSWILLGLGGFFTILFSIALIILSLNW
jgi:hypothetical protein